MATAGSLVLRIMLSFALLLLSAASVATHGTTSSDPDHGLAPFGFIEKLRGCRPGETNVTGLRKLKAYMNWFGYPSSEDHLHDDEFEASLEAAIKAYQMNYGLSPSGALDGETVERMMAPRCGCPDAVNSTVRLASGMEMKKQGMSEPDPELLGYNFLPNRPRWPVANTILKFGFLPDVPSYAEQPIINAFGQWEAATRFTFEHVKDVARADLTVGFYRGAHGDESPFDGRGGVVGHAFAPTDGRMHFDADETWSTDPAPRAMDLETVAGHEIGHLLGLGHSQIPEAVMFSEIPAGGKRKLHADDIEGVRALYS